VTGGREEPFGAIATSLLIMWRKCLGI